MSETGDRIGFSLRDGLELAGVSVVDVWWRYLAVGGTCSAAAVADHVMGVSPCGRHEHDLIAQALNETFIDLGMDTFPVAYAADGPVRRNGPAGSPAPRQCAVADQARRDAALARLRSAAAARKAAVLHANAAQLMQASGQLLFARHARIRSQVAQHRAAIQVSVPAGRP